MKKLLITALLIIMVGCATTKSTPTVVADSTIERIVEAPGYSKEQVFNGTKVWIAENFKSSKAVLEYENKEDGTIIGNSIISYPCSGFLTCVSREGWKVPFTMRVDVKDQKFRLTFINLRLLMPPNYDVPLRAESYVADVRPILLAFGDQLLASFGKNRGKSNW